jgi:RNA polymerase sigma-70 factor (ECF subfamily)
MAYAELSDEDLLAEARRAAGPRREALVNELFARHYERVARWCLRFTGDRDRAADLAQDVFLKAHRHLDSFKGASRFSTWLYTIVRNESFNRLQRAGPPSDAEEVLLDIAALEAGPEELANRSQRRRHVRDFLAITLDRLERTVFVLHYGEDMPLDAITRLLRLENTSGAKAYIVSARRKLAKATQRLRARGETL